MVGVARGEGAQYRPSPGPQDVDPKLLTWCQREFDRIAVAINEGRSQWVRLDVLETQPSRPVEGMICYFMAGVAGSGSLKGFYGYDGTAWAKF